MHRKILLDLLALPTAPYHEEHVAAYIRDWASGHPAIDLRTDRFGNIRAHLRRGNKRCSRPFLFSAHMDHPGFEAREMTGTQTLKAIWRGWVEPAYFRNARVRFFVGDRWTRGRIMSFTTRQLRGRERVQTVTVEVEGPVPRGAIGMWDLPDPVIRGRRIHARGCDDVAGVAAILCALDDLSKHRGAFEVYGLFTRAEEVGFAGAIAACRSGILPRQARIVAVESSSVIPGARMGDGPILRVGDATAIFPPTLTASIAQVGRRLARKDQAFTMQRKLMDGGSTETLAYLHFGHEATGMCLAMGNYHNMDRRRGRIAPECIDLDDFAGLVKWFVALLTDRRTHPDRDPFIEKMIRRLERTCVPKLAISSRLPR